MQGWWLSWNLEAFRSEKISAFQIQLNTTHDSIVDCVSKGQPTPIQHTEKLNGSRPVHAQAPCTGWRRKKLRSHVQRLTFFSHYILWYGNCKGTVLQVWIIRRLKAPSLFNLSPIVLLVGYHAGPREFHN